MNKKDKISLLNEISEDEDLLEIGRLAIENELVYFRDNMMSQIRGNGLVIKEFDGTPSDIIRFGPEIALKIGLKAIAESLSS